MRKTYKYRLYPNKTTEKNLYWTLNRCRELYNAALAERKDAYQRYQRTAVIASSEQTVVATMVVSQRVKSINYYDQQNDLPEIKEIRPEYKDIGAHVLQNVVKRVDLAFQAFYRRVKNGETPGYPRFQGRNRYDSFCYPDQNGWKIDGKHLHLSKIGDIKIKVHRAILGQIKTCTIKREGTEWYAVFSCEVEEEHLPASSNMIGIDLGLLHFATLSDGETIENPRYYRRAEKILEYRQQALSRKKRGSHRRDRARKLVAKAHRKIARQRRDFLHKESRKLVNIYGMMVFEDLQVSNLIKRPKPKQDEATGQYLPNGASAKAGLNKSLSDAGWGMFIDFCSYKAEWAGRNIIKVNPKYTSQICSGCGTIVKKDLEERWHSCTCGTELNRDHNAAINILRLGRSPQGQPCRSRANGTSKELKECHESRNMVSCGTPHVALVSKQLRAMSQ